MMQTWPNFGFTVAYVGSGGSLSLTPVAGAIAFTGYAPTISSGSTDAAITPSITTNRTAASNTGVAPLAVQFNAKSTTAASYTSKPLYELFHAWNFSDTGAGTHDYGTKAGTASRNTAYGHTVSHVFETPGTYVVDYTCWNPGTLTYNTSSVTITVQDPDTVFAGANTICIANGTLPVAGVNGVPSGATCVNTSSWATVAGYITAGKRVLLKRGDTWTTTTSAAVTSAGPGIVGAFGTGAKPKITINANVDALYFQSAHDWRVVDLELTANDGGSDAANDSRRAVRASTSNFLTQLRVEAYNVYEGTFLQTCDDAGIFQCNYHDILSVTGGIVGYFEYMSRFSVVGTRFSDGALTHTFRVTGGIDCVYSHSDFKYAGSTRHAFTLRSWGTDTSKTTRYHIMSDCRVVSGSGAGWVIALKPNDGTINNCLRDVLLERNFIESENGCASSLQASIASDYWVRNNIIKETNDSALIIEQANTAGAPNPSSNYIYNNTFWKPNTTSSSAFSAIELRANTTGHLIKNNLSYAPGMTRDGAGDGSQGTFLVLRAGVTGSDYTLSNNSSDAQQQNTKPWSVTTPATYAQYVPNSYGVDGGTTVPIYDDFTGAAISGTREIGAIQA